MTLDEATTKCPTCGHPLEPSDAPEARPAATAALRAEVRGRVVDVTWEGWLCELEVVGMQDEALVIRVADRDRNWVDARYRSVLEDAASRLADQPVPVLVVGSQWRAVAEDG